MPVEFFPEVADLLRGITSLTIRLLHLVNTATCWDQLCI